jgi:hypothetical protein
MQVLAKNSRGGRRYLTQKNVRVEVAPMSYKDDRPRRDGHGNILVWMVADNGELDKSRLVQIPMGYALVDPGHEKGKRGRRPHADKTWRGWAHTHPELPKSVLDEAQTQGCYHIAATNYITVGLNGRKLLVVFRSGVLGFDTLPRYFVAFKNKKVPGRFSPVRVELRKVVADGLRVELVRAVRQYIADFKTAQVV